VLVFETYLKCYLNAYVFRNLITTLMATTSVLALGKTTYISTSLYDQFHV